MDKRRADIEKYLKGELTSAQRHALEKEALTDPFLADALEGMALIDPADFSNDVTGLNEKIVGRKVTWTWPVRIAATLLLLAVSMFILWIALKQDPEQQPLAMEPASRSNNLPRTGTDSSGYAEKKSADAEPSSSTDSTGKKIILAPTESKQASEKSSRAHAETKEIKQASESKQPISAVRKGNRKPVTKNQLTEEQKAVTIDPDKKHEFIPPLANDIKVAEGFIAAIDARPTIVTGRVLSAEDGTPLPDVSVVLKGTSVMTKTDAYGQYSITATSQQKTLVYSSEGLESTEVKIDGIDSTYLPVKLEITEEAQEEAAVETTGMPEFGPTHVYTIPAHPEIGNRAFKQYLIKNHNYPKDAKETKIEGTVVIEFKVDTSGALSEFRIVRGIGNGCDEEVIRLILQGARWVPTTKDGTPVIDKARVKFKFELEQ